MGGGDLPVNCEVGVGAIYSSFTLRVVEGIAFVLEEGLVAQDCKSVGEAFGKEELAVVFAGEEAREVATEGGGTFAQVEGYVEYFSLHAAHEFCLGVGGTLEVKASNNSFCGKAFVVLYKSDGAY